MGLIRPGGMGTVEVRPCSCAKDRPEPASPHLPWQPAEVPGAAQGLQPRLCQGEREGSRAQGRQVTGAHQEGTRPHWGVAKDCGTQQWWGGRVSITGPAATPPLGTAAACWELQAPAMVPVGDKAAGPSAKRRGTAG